MQADDVERKPNKRFLSFIIFGGLNTAITYLLYLFLSSFLHHQIAYFISYASGILLAYTLNLIFVFNARSSFKKIIRYPFIYLIQYFLGAGLLYVFLIELELPNIIAPLLVAVLLLPISYLMNKIILTSDSNTYH